MSELRENLASPAWWFTVLVAGLLVNIAAAYLQKLLDSRLVRASGWLGRRRQKRDRARRALIDLLRDSPHKQLIYATSESRYRIRGILYMVLGIVSAFSGMISLRFLDAPWIGALGLGSGTVLLVVGLNDLHLAEQTESVLKELHKDLPL